MKNKLAIVFLSTVLAFPTLASIAHAASYSTTFEFSAAVTGPYRSFSSASDISVATSASAATFGASSSTFSLSLQRNTWYGYTTIGTVSHPRNGSKTSTWSNVGSGDYRIYLSKNTDGITVKGTATISD